MARVGIAIHRFREDAVSVGRDIAVWCAANGHSCVSSGADLPVLTSAGAPGISSDDVFEDVDVLVSIGGDGTMLRSVRSLGGRATPVIGVNVGLLGYLTGVEQASAVEALGIFLNGECGKQYSFDDRMLVRVRVWTGGSYVGEHFALNEIVVEKKEAGHTVRLAVDIDGAHFTTYAADGLIVASPTGSTAYSMSARGPILSPRMRALLVTPVSPHMLFDRALVLDSTERIRIEVLGHRSVNVASDGELVHSLRPGDVVEVDAAEEFARFVRFEETRFHQILKSKFGLADR
ncbi:MAG: inorganic polyphosphate/ATP-NAD kinase [Actinomycetota bacterium]